MSELLEKAIADATALKEVAMKNAESVFLEKYSIKIKEAVEQLLEQDPEEEDPNAEMVSDVGDVPPEDMLGGTSTGEETIVSDQVPMAAMDGGEEGFGPEEEIEIDFSELEKQLSGEKDLDASEMTDREEIASEMPMEEEPPMEEIPQEEEIYEECGDMKECGLQQEKIMEEEDNIDNVDEETLKEIIEALEVDFEPKLDGWLGTNDTKKAEAIEGILAKSQDDEAKEGLEAMKKALEDIQESNKKFQKEQEKIIKENKELKKNLKIVVEKLNESNIMNAKYLYMNKVLGEKSLNEKQKAIFVESLSKSNSVDKAKVIYETLLSSMGTSQEKRISKSLNEVVSRPSMTSPIKPKVEKVISDPIMERMKYLAGIKK